VKINWRKLGTAFLTRLWLKTVSHEDPAKKYPETQFQETGFPRPWYALSW
jgi:hypothetical protein